MMKPTVSLWRQCELAQLSEPALKVLLELIAAYETQWGRYPTPAQLLKELRGRP